MDDRRRKTIIGLAIAASDRLVQPLDAESDNESDEEQSTVTFVLQCRLRLRGSPLKPVRNEDYFDDTIPRYTDVQFRQHFRVTRATFMNLENRLRPVLSTNQGTTGRPRIDVRKQLLAVLWLLATPESFRSVADRFDMGKSSVHDCFQRVIKALSGEAHNLIVWPTGQKLEHVKAGFGDIGVLPNVIGAVDGSLIEIPKPKADPIYYKTRKKTYAIVLQAVCDASLLFTDCHAGHPGSVPDIRVFRNSDLYHAVNENHLHYFPGDEYIIGDKAYPILSWCIAPFINRGQMTRDQRRFNTALSTMRQVIERAFALLKGRFRRLKYLDMERIDLMPMTILACCVLHNVCILGMDEDDDDQNEFIGEGHAVNGHQQEINAEHELVQDIPLDPAGGMKRNHLVNVVIQRLDEQRARH